MLICTAIASAIAGSIITQHMYVMYLRKLTRNHKKTVENTRTIATNEGFRIGVAWLKEMQQTQKEINRLTRL